MKYRDNSFWPLLPLPLWITIFAGALIFTALFCWLATVYHWYAVTPSSGWLQYVGLACESFVFSLNALSAFPIGLKRAQLTAMPWYMQGDILRGIAGVALIVLMIFNGIGSVSASIAIAIGQVICLLIAAAAFIWMFIAPTQKYRPGAKERM